MTGWPPVMCMSDTPSAMPRWTREVNTCMVGRVGYGSIWIDRVDDNVSGNRCQNRFCPSNL
jgi:hypothetical protein